MTALAPVQAESPRGNKSTPPNGTPTAERKTRRRSKVKRGLEPWLYLAPAFIVLIALLGYPIFQLINVSL
jgi:N,N'-diacetylchitobiose transport system permease protein